MANVNSPYGLKLLSSITPVVIVKASVLATDSAVLGEGDPVKLVQLGDGGKLTVSRYTAGDGIDGVVVNTRVSAGADQNGWKYTDNDRRRPSLQLSQVEVMLCQPGDGKVFSIQADEALSATQSNKFFNLSAPANADRYTNLSVAQLDSSTAHASEGDLKLLGLDDSVDGHNDITEAFAKVKVVISNT